MKAMVITTGGAIKEVAPANNHDFSLEELQKFVGGYIEIISLSESQIMVLNEEGKLNNLPYNEEATKLFQKAYKTNDFIVGDVLVCDSEMVQ